MSENMQDDTKIQSSSETDTNFKMIYLYPKAGSIVIEPSLIVEQKFNALEVCCTCLSKYPSESLINEIANAYKNITGLQLSEEMPSKICDICSKELLKADDFRTKCLESYKWLVKMRDQLSDENEKNTEQAPLNTVIDKKSDRKSNISVTYSSGSEMDNDVTDTYEETKKVKKRKSNLGKNADKKTKKSPNYNVNRLCRSKTETEKEDQEIDKLFESRVLSKEEQIEQFLKRKESSSYLNAKFKCEICYTGFGVIETFERHKPKHDWESGKIFCDICSHHFQTASMLTSHILRQHKMIWNCNKCEYVTISKGRALLHMYWHNGKKYCCQHCGKVCMRMSTLLSHIRIRHPSDHVCSFCGYSFIGENGLNCHIRLKHKDEQVPLDGPKCDECNITFANDEALSAHITTSKKHGGKKSNCSKQYKYNYNTKGTKGSKSTCNSKGTRNNWTCEQCGQVCKTIQTYKYHFNKYHSSSTITEYPEDVEPQLCFVCGKTFSSYTSLYIHLSKHEDSDNSSQYTCEICNKTFNNNVSYKRHVLMLHKKKQKEYTCGICDKVFGLKTNRDRHMTYVHTDLRTEKCNFCEKTFKSKPEKKIHEEYVHLKKPYKKRNRSNRSSLDWNIESNR